MKNYLTEFIGTFLFLFVIALIAPSGSPLTPLAIGGALMVMVYMGGPISGGHYNPAVTLGLAIAGKLPWKEVAPYWGSQLLGGAGAFLLGGYVSKSASIAPGKDATSIQALIVEIVFTLALVLTVLNVAATKKTSGNSYFGLAIGFVIVCAAAAGGPISGGAFNPAVGIGATLAGSVYGGLGWSNVWLYIVGPVLGAGLAALIYGLQKPDEATA